MPIDSFQSDSEDTQSAETMLATTPSASEKEISRALPRVSFRAMLGIVTVGAAIAFAARQAYDGSVIATAIVYSLATVAISFGFFAALFLIAWIPAILGRDSLEDLNLGNPFSSDQLPPQVLPPRDPGT